MLATWQACNTHREQHARFVIFGYLHAQKKGVNVWTLAQNRFIVNKSFPLNRLPTRTLCAKVFWMRLSSTQYKRDNFVLKINNPLIHSYMMKKKKTVFKVTLVQ